VKALLCGACGDIQALQVDWRTCACGNTSARWIDPRRGTAEFRAINRRDAFLLGLNNQLLLPAMRGELGIWEDYREVHEQATDAPGYVFDKSRAGCWAVVVRVGITDDAAWAADDGVA
jgi:hypothetical protein